ncbi:MAG TPA: restriction endonuclease subunit R [Lapillicoccus sp.]
MPGPERALPDDWLIGASSFNWTPDVVRAQRSVPDIAVGIATARVAEVLELEAGQVWRSFPVPGDDEVDALRDALDAVGGRVSIVGASIDDFLSPSRRRSDDERLAFLEPQLRAAHRVGAWGLRLPFGQPGRPLLERVQPLLHELDLTLYEEIQGQQSLTDPAVDTIRELANDHIRLLVDTSMFMPALPPSYLERLRHGGVPEPLVGRLTDAWLDPHTHQMVVDQLRSGTVPDAVRTLYMNLLVRFGRADVAELRDVMDVVAGFHLKFWDLDDAGDRVSGPIRELGRLLAGTGFSGTLTSEWGGHEWLEQDPTTTTRQHLELARRALADGVAAA